MRVGGNLAFDVSEMSSKLWPCVGFCKQDQKHEICKPQ